MGFLFSLLELIRDLVLIAAGIGVAKLAWDWHKAAPQREAQASRTLAERVRIEGEIKQWAGKMQALALEVSARHEEIAEREREHEERARLKARIHSTLHATEDPFLSFEEIRAALGSTSKDGGGSASVPEAEAVRAAIIELLADGAIDQMPRDRYFIASEFETDEER